MNAPISKNFVWRDEYRRLIVQALYLPIYFLLTYGDIEDNVPTNPLHGAHAISEVAFALQLQNPFDPDTVRLLIGLQKDLEKEELQHMQPTYQIQVTLSPSPMQPLPNIGAPSPSGVIFRSDNISSPPTTGWMLRADNNQLTVNCLTYTRWVDVWARAQRFLSLATGVMSNSDNRVTAIILQYIDQFLIDGQDYSPQELFSDTSPYLTKQAFNSGRLWHLHQGYFDQLLDIKTKRLNVLNIATTHDRTLVDHSQHIVFPDAPLSIVDTENRINSVMQELHERNKEVLLHLLSGDMLERIGLRPGVGV